VVSNTRYAAAGFALAVGLVLCLAPTGVAVDLGELPPCWELTSTYRADEGTLEGFGRRFGVELEALTNHKIDAGGIPLQVNTVVCRSPEDAVTVHEFFMTAREASPQKYLRDGHVVYEFLCDNYGVRAKMQEHMGIRKRYQIIYRVTAEVVPLESSDDMKWNLLYNALRGGSDDLSGLAADFEFGSRLVLRHERPEWGAPEYTFSIEPASRSEQGDLVEVAFGALPRTQGVPRVTMDATVPVRAFAPNQPGDPVNAYRLTRPTGAWPAGHTAVAAVLEEAVDPGASAREKIEQILCWVFENIRYDGDVVGSRYGTATVLEQGVGHCWDKADVFVTLCRAAGVPARQVMGWLRGVETGHVWAQAYDDRSGWISVDATASWTGTDERYIPLFILEDGRAPFVYASTPQWTPVRPTD
jgi:hypothetical protein